MIRHCKILRTYRCKSPSRFYNIMLRVWKCLTDNPRIPGSIWAAHPELLPLFLTLAAKYHEVYQRASLYSSKLDIAEREVLQPELIEYMDEIAAVLEAASVRNPDLLVISGFDLTKERRNLTRANVPQTTSEDANVQDTEQTPS